MESDSAFRNAESAVGAAAGRAGQPRDRPTSLDKALELCEVLAGADRGLSIKQLAQSARMPATRTRWSVSTCCVRAPGHSSP